MPATNMKSVTLPDGTSLPVLGLGTFSYGGGHQADYSRDEEAVAAMRSIIDLGYTHLDTAESYGKNHCEEIVGEAIKSFDRSDLFITTKVAPEHLRPDDVLRSADGSLKRMGIDSIDLYLIHWPNAEIPLKDTFQGLNTLLDDGRVKRVGVSNFSVDQLRRAMELCSGPIITNQVRYNLLHRDPEENGLLQFCQDNSVYLTAYSPLKDDVLSNPTVKEIAGAHNASPAQIALAWLIRQPKVITIPRTGDLAHARDNLGALNVELSDDEVSRLNAIT